MKQARADRPREILVVDDNPGDIVLLERAFAATPDAPLVRAVESAEAALRYLRREGEHAHALLPDLVLLDLHLPGRDGRSVLEAVKADPGLRWLPVVVLTTSNNPDDVRACEQRHANAFVRKPFGLEGYRQLAASLAAFWLRLARRSTD